MKEALVHWFHIKMHQGCSIITRHVPSQYNLADPLPMWHLSSNRNLLAAIKVWCSKRSGVSQKKNFKTVLTSLQCPHFRCEVITSFDEQKI